MDSLYWVPVISIRFPNHNLTLLASLEAALNQIRGWALLHAAAGFVPKLRVRANG